MISKETSEGTVNASIAGGSTTALFEFIGVLGANAAALGLLISAAGLSVGIIFYTLNYIETKRHNKAVEDKD